MFKDAVTYLETYYQDRTTRLRGVQRQRWFTSPASTYAEILKKFERKDENELWLKHFTRQVPANQVMMRQLDDKLAWLCGCTRDLRKQFACSMDDRARIPADAYRFQLLFLDQVRKTLKWHQDAVERKPVKPKPDEKATKQ